MNITQQELERLQATQSESSWNAVCDEIKKARGGQYPPDWWQQVMMSGLTNEVTNQWGSTDE